VQRATAQSKTGIFRDYGVAEAPPGFQAGWSNCMYFFSLFLFILFAHLEALQQLGKGLDSSLTKARLLW
jgi:hypothetical protein